MWCPPPFFLVSVSSPFYGEQAQPPPPPPPPLPPPHKTRFHVPRRFFFEPFFPFASENRCSREFCPSPPLETTSPLGSFRAGLTGAVFPPKPDLLVEALSSFDHPGDMPLLRFLTVCFSRPPPLAQLSPGRSKFRGPHKWF